MSNPEQKKNITLGYLFKKRDGNIWTSKIADKYAANYSKIAAGARIHVRFYSEKEQQELAQKYPSADGREPPVARLELIPADGFQPKAQTSTEAEFAF